MEVVYAALSVLLIICMCLAIPFIVMGIVIGVLLSIAYWAIKEYVAYCKQPNDK